MPELPVFPLGTVLLPGQLLPLQVFEPRYRVMLFDLRATDPAEFVVVLIERGSEVGGGEERSEVGCVARILERQDLPDGRSMVACVGLRPAVMEQWLPEDPYPRADVRDLDFRDWPDDQPTTGLDALTARAREVAGLAAGLGAPPWPQDLELADEPVQLLWQLAIATPLATLDRQKLLGEPDPVARAGLLRGFLDEQADLLAARLEWEADT